MRRHGSNRRTSSDSCGLLTYRVDDIRTVLPEELRNERINENEDRVSLFTCTPYGMNTHRLVVSGVKVPNDTTQQPSAYRLPIRLMVALAFMAMLAVALAIAALRRHHPRHKAIDIQSLPTNNKESES